MRKLLIGAITLYSALAIPASAASFDCAQASSRIDNAICASPQLSKLDDDLDAAYKAALAKNGDPDAVKTAQRAWLKETRNQCADEVCLLTVYQQRIAALNASVAPDANAKPEMREDTEAAEDAADANEAAAASAQKAAAAASAAQAQKVAEQAAAATSAAKARELTDKAAADALHSAEQKRMLELSGGAVALFALIIALLFRIRRHTTVKAAQKKGASKNTSDAQVEQRIATINEINSTHGVETSIASTPTEQDSDVIAPKIQKLSDQKIHQSRVAKIARLLLASAVGLMIGLSLTISVAVFYTGNENISIIILAFSIFLLSVVKWKITWKPVLFKLIIPAFIGIYIAIGPLHINLPSPSHYMSTLNENKVLINSNKYSSVNAPIDPFDRLKNEYYSFDERCQKILGESTLELIGTMNKIREYGPTHEGQGMGSVRAQLDIIKSFGCSPK